MRSLGDRPRHLRRDRQPGQAAPSRRSIIALSAGAQALFGVLPHSALGLQLQAANGMKSGLVRGARLADSLGDIVRNGPCCAPQLIGQQSVA
jgi:hypothetical protein